MTEKRGPYRLATEGMPDWLRQSWWKSCGEIEVERANYKTKNHIPFEELGPDIKIPTGKMSRHGNRKTVREIDRDCACQWYRRGSWDGNEWGL